MINKFTPHGHSAQLKCQVCDCVITYPDNLLIQDPDNSACRSFDCKRIMHQKSTMSPLMFKSHLDFNRKLIKKRRANSAFIKKHIDDVTAKENIENNDIISSVLKERSMSSTGDFHLLTIPSGHSITSSCNNERINSYIEHLKDIIKQATEYSNFSEVDFDEHHDAYEKRQISEKRLTQNPALKTISDHLCCICKGGCCASGKEHAYLSVFSMRRYMDTNPELHEDEVLNLYLSYINSESIENSCINQTESGCALPRELRSDICNGYYCDPLKSYQRKMTQQTMPDKVLAIQRSSTYWNRFELNVCNAVINIALVDENKIDFVSLPNFNQKTLN